jgi:DNA repair exonuclease SbcCD ATPase subunit
MKTQNYNPILLFIIGILIILLGGCLFYIFNLKENQTVLETTIVTVNSEKDSMIKDLEDLRSTYDVAIAENTEMSDELIAERDKVQKLMAELKSSNGDVTSLQKYKKEFKVLEKKMQNLMQEIEVLKKQNETLTTNLDSTNVVLEDNKKYNEVLVSQNEELAKTVEKGSKLSIVNLKAASFKLKTSGKQIETDKAQRTDMLKINFSIAENKIAKSGDKMYYVQVIDAKNNVLGVKHTIYFGELSLTYSFTTTVKYENKTVEVSEQLLGKDFVKGNYYVNVFDKNELVSKTSFSLK